MKSFRYSLLIIVLSLGSIDSTDRIAHAQAPPIPLEDVIVTATRQQELILTIPAHVTVITAEEIERSNATHIGELLREEAGLWVTNTSGSTPTGMIIDGRGFNNGGGNGGRILVLIDGRRSNLVDTSNPDWSTIPVDTIERIEIVRGSASALYGDNAVAGVINIITKQGYRKPTPGVSLERGSYDFRKRSAILSGTDGNLSYYLYGGYETSGGYRANSDYQALNYGANFRNRISPFTTLHFRGSYLSNRVQQPDSLTESQILTLGRDGSAGELGHGPTHHAKFDITVDSHLNKFQWLELNGGQTFRGQRFRGVGGDYNADSRASALTGKYRITSGLAGRESRLMLGVDFMEENIRNIDFPSLEITNFDRRLAGAYANERLTIHPALILSLSGRIDRAKMKFSKKSGSTTLFSGERSFRVWSSKSGLTYLTSPMTTMFVNWSRSFRFPNRDELTGFFGITPVLDPERATTYEVGSTVRAGQNFQATSSVYRMRVENEILNVPVSLGGSGNENIPEIQHEGLEVSGKGRLGDGVTIKGNYAVTRSEIREGPFQGHNFPITPKHAGGVRLDFGRGTGFNLWVAGRFIGKRILMDDLTNIQMPLPAYSVFDAKLSYKGDSLDLFFGSNNLLNRKYEEYGGVDSSGTVIVYPSPERNFIWGGTLRF